MPNALAMVALNTSKGNAQGFGLPHGDGGDQGAEVLVYNDSGSGLQNAPICFRMP